MKTVFTEPKATIYISDIHGDMASLKRVEEMPEFGNPDYQFVFGGDYVDGSIYGIEVLQYIKDACDAGWAKAIIGNHDKMLTTFVRDPSGDNKRLYYLNGGKHTLKHACGDVGYSASRMAAMVLRTYPDIIHWLETLPTAIEDDYKLCVHAGIDWDAKDYHNTDDTIALWIREAYIYDKEQTAIQENNTGKIIVSGHTPTVMVTNDDDCPITVLTAGSNPRYLIDGGEHAKNNSFNALVLKKNGLLEAAYKIGADFGVKKERVVLIR